MAFPRANIHQILTPDLLHQLIKGTFKDHVVTWVEKYIRETHLLAWADKILADIDRQYESPSPVHDYISQCQPLAVLLQCHHSQDCVTSTRDTGSNNGLVMIQRG